MQSNKRPITKTELSHSIERVIKKGFTVSDPYYSIQGTFGLGYTINENHDVSSISGMNHDDMIIQFQTAKAAAKYFVDRVWQD